MFRVSAVLLCLSLAWLGETFGERNAITARAAGQPDTWSLEGIVESVTAGLTEDREKALALHKFGMAHQIHFVGPMEEYSYLSDALKVLSVYGYSLCGPNSTAMSALYNLAGMNARRRFIVGHVVPEVFFDGSWNYIDTDMFGYVLKADGSIASVDEILEDPDLLDHPFRPDPFFPFDGADNMKRAFINADGLKDCHPYSLSHILSLNLRSREKVTCYYRPQGRYYVHSGQMQQNLSPSWPRYWIEGPIRQNSLAWTDESPPAYGNGHFLYEPELSSKEFLKENPRHAGVSTLREKGRPELISAKTGSPAQLILEMSTPWVIAGVINDPTNFQDNAEGAVVSGWFWRGKEVDGNQIEVSVDGGRSWQSVWENPRLGAVPFRVDVTRLVEGRYSYLLKFSWSDPSGSRRVGLSDLKVETWTELSPMALPHLKPGGNELRVSSENTKAHFVESRWHEGGELYGQEVKNLELFESFPFMRRVDRDRSGSVAFDLGTDKRIQELRLSIEAGCTANEKAREVGVEAFLSKDGGKSWEDLAKYSVDPEHQKPSMWFNHVLKKIHLDGSQTRLKVIVQNGSLSAIRVGCRISAVPLAPSDLKFTHVWRQGDSMQSEASVLSAGADSHVYRVEIPDGIRLVNRELIIEALPPGNAR